MSDEKRPLNKKLIAIIAAVLAVVIAISVIFVVKNKNTDGEETTTEATTVVETTVSDVKSDETTALETETTELATNRKTVKEFVKNDLGISDSIISEGKMLPNGVVYFVDEPIDSSKDFFKSRSVVVDTGERFLTKELFNGVGKADIYYADIDGEKGEEIVIHMNTGGNGGYGSYVSYIFGVEKDKIYEYYNSEKDNIIKNTFESRLEAPFKAVVYCRDTGYEKILDFSDKDFSDKKYLYDAEGNPSDDYAVNFDSSFYRFEPKDVDEDGVYEIVCRQYASIGSHVSCAGFTELVLSFDNGYEITNAKFTEGPDKSFGYQE